jgi:hypothetical protein
MLPSILIPDRVFSYRIDGPAAETFAANLCEHLKRTGLCVRVYTPSWVPPPERPVFLAAGHDATGVDKMFDRTLSRGAVGRVVHAETATRGKLVYGAAGQPPIDLSDDPQEPPRKAVARRARPAGRKMPPVRGLLPQREPMASLPSFITRGMVSC